MTQNVPRTAVSPDSREGDYRFLRTQLREEPNAKWPALRVVDLFAGCGGMTLGLWEAARRASLRLDIAMAVDSQPNFVSVFVSNFPESRAIAADVAALVDGDLGAKPSPQECRLKKSIGSLHVLLGGPPCQGHSDLNNHTRRSDPKNALYLRMARAAEVLRPAVVIIENVPPVQWDTSDVVGRAKMALEKAGYQVDGRVLDLSRVGVPQTRKRFLLMASRFDSVDPVLFMDAFESRPPTRRDLRWAIGDLENVVVETTFDTPTQMSADNKRRVAYLFKHRVFDLPNAERPPCHRDNDHSYKSMYGRLRWNEPAQTVTTGFGSMGQGRYVHPSQRRTLTPHEAARLQTFPDWFSFEESRGRTELATLIGNAVPPLLMTALGSDLLDRHGPALLGMGPDEGAVADEEPCRSVEWRRPMNTQGARRARVDDSGQGLRAARPRASSANALRRMQNQGRRDTAAELAVRRAVWSQGLRYRVDVAPVPGRRRADLVFSRARVAVYVDGCFWHSCPIHATAPKANREWWQSKLATNRTRDADTERCLAAAGWMAVRVWEHEEPKEAASRIASIVTSRQSAR